MHRLPMTRCGVIPPPIRAALLLLIPAITMAPAIAHPAGGHPPAIPAVEGPFDHTIDGHAEQMITEGRTTFRYDTFGDQNFWGGMLHLHEAVAGAAHGGVGPGLSPRAALGLGLKVDLDALSNLTVQAIREGQIDLDDPAVTLQLMRQNAVVGVTGFFNGDELQSMGIQCALCHSTVDDALAPGMGHRLDGWANRDLNVGAIVALAPDLTPIAEALGVDVATVITVLNSWGPGKFDAELFLDGKAFQPDGRSAATLIPPAFGQAGVNLHTYEGWGSVTYWNAFVANLEMHGQGTFFDPRLDDPVQFPLAAQHGYGHVQSQDDLITAKLPALHFYQLAIPAPAPPPGSFDEAAAARGDVLFSGKARCSQCHVDELYTEPGWHLHSGEEIGIDNFQADRAPDHRYRTTPLRGLWTHQRGGFYHDGRFATLDAVLDHYDQFFGLGLSAGEKNDLAQYLLSLGDEDAAVAAGPATPALLERASQAAALPRDVWSLRLDPSPGRRGADFAVELLRTGDALFPADLSADVYDVRGRRLASLDRQASAGAGSTARFTWNTRDRQGAMAPAGVYFVRVASRSAGYTEDRKVVLR